MSSDRPERTAVRGHRSVLGQRRGESFFGTLKRELANRRRWETRADARRYLIRWIEGWFTARRLHSSIDYNAPVEFETLHYRGGDGIAA